MEQEPKTVGKSTQDPRFSTSLSITRGAKTHRGSKDRSGVLINDTVEFQVTVTLTESSAGTISQSELFNEASSYLNDAYFDEMECNHQLLRAMTGDE